MAVQIQEIRDAFLSYQTDKGFVHGYDQMYSVVFDIIGNPESLLEIGFHRGYSAAAWKHLLPEATLQFVDKVEPAEITPPAVGLPLLIQNSVRSAITEAVGQNFDIIIDDGDHRPDYQWQTFLNLEVVQADLERNLLLVKGSVPGPNGGVVIIRNAVKGAVKE